MPESTLVRPLFPAAAQKFPPSGLQDIIRCHCCGEMQQLQHHHQQQMVAFNGALTPHLPFQDSLAAARFAQPYFENHVQARFRMPPHNDGYLHPAHHMIPRSGRSVTQFDSLSNKSDKRVCFQLRHQRLRQCPVSSPSSVVSFLILIVPEEFCSVLAKSHLGAKRDFEIWAFKGFLSLDTKNTP